MEQLIFKEQSYQVITLLGKGKGGYSYLVSDKQGREYVLKKIHHEPCDYYTFDDKMAAEIRDYNKLKALDITMPQLIDYDSEAELILKEYIPGKTIYQYIKEDEMDDKFLDDILEMTNILFQAQLNIDYFPTNFIPYNDKLYYVDYECNSYIEKWDFAHWGIKYWSKTDDFITYDKNKGENL